MRLLGLVRAGAIDLSGVRFIALDEADKLFELNKRREGTGRDHRKSKDSGNSEDSEEEGEDANGANNGDLDGGGDRDGDGEGDGNGDDSGRGEGRESRTKSRNPSFWVAFAHLCGCDHGAKRCGDAR